MLALLTTTAALAQTGGVTIGATQAADASAALDVISSAKGALLPRLTAAQRLGIATPAPGLIVFQTDAPTSGTGAGTGSGFWFNSGTGAAPAWQRLADSRDVSYSPATGLAVGGTPNTIYGAYMSDVSNSTPFHGETNSNRIAFFLSAASLGSAGLQANRLITSLGLYVVTKNSTGPFDNFTVKLGNTTTNTTATPNAPTDPLTTVFVGSLTTVAGLTTLAFTTPFRWDGTSGLYLELCFNNATPVASSPDVIQGTVTATTTTHRVSGTAVCATNYTLSNIITPVLVFGQAPAYTLPATAGAAGQVLTQQADGTVAFANVPWTQTGTNLYPTTLASNVGIGTTTPGQKLEVAGSVYTNSESAGLLVDAGGAARVGLLKYGGREAGIWRTTTQDFEIGRVSNGATAITALPGSPSTFTTDLYVAADGKIGLGTTAPFSQLANTASNMNGSDGQGGNAGSLAWSTSQNGYVGLFYNSQTTTPGNGLAVKVAGTAAGSSVLDLSAGTAQTTVGTNLLNVRANGAVSIPGTLTVGIRLTTGPITHSVQVQAAPTSATTIVLTAALLRLTDNGSTTNGTVTLGTTGVQEGQQLLITNLDPQNVTVTYVPGLNLTLAQYVTGRFVYSGGSWSREL